jgi:hypothetical protein
MALTLNLGVVDMPYSAESYKEHKIKFAKRGKSNKPVREPSNDAASITTGDVAKILEEKYGILDTFKFARLPDIAKMLEESMAKELENMMMGQTPTNPFQGAEAKITQMMKDFLSTQAVESMGIEGVPTQAALDGVNHRLKHPYAHGNPRRPSFIDTSLMQQSYKAWVE